MIIKFNLTPRKRIEEVKEKKFPFLSIYLSLLLTLIIALSVFIIKTQFDISNLRKEKKEKEETLTRYKSIAKKVKEMEREKEELKKRIETIINLKSKQGKNLKNLFALLSNINSGKLILTNLKLDNNRSNLKGLGLDMDFLALYMEELEKTKEIIKGVNLKSAQQKNLNNIKFIEFEIEVQF